MIDISDKTIEELDALLAELKKEKEKREGSVTTETVYGRRIYLGKSGQNDFHLRMENIDGNKQMIEAHLPGHNARVLYNFLKLNIEKQKPSIG